MRFQSEIIFEWLIAEFFKHVSRSDGGKWNIVLGDTERDMKQLVKLFKSLKIICLKVNSILLFHISFLVCTCEIPWTIQQSTGIAPAAMASGVLFSEPQEEENNLK